MTIPIGMIALNPEYGNYWSKNPLQLIAELLRQGCTGFKVQEDLPGLPVREIPRVIKRLKRPDVPVLIMYDRKIGDIGSSVITHIKQDLENGYDRTTVHVNEDTFPELEYVAKRAPELFEKIVGVAVLTSQSTQTIEKHHGVTRRTLLLRRLAIGCKLGIRETVCGVHEVKMIQKHRPELRAFYAPGTRLPGAEKHDQEIVGTPREAYRAGACFIVGRPVVNDPDPGAAYQAHVNHALGN